LLRKRALLRWTQEQVNATIVTTRGILCMPALFASAYLFFFPAPALSALQNQSAPQRHSTSSAAIAEARSALANQNAAAAIQILSNYLQTKPQDSAARTLLGQAYASLGQNDRAEEEFRAVLQSAPDDSIALAALGELYLQAGQLEKAEPLLAHAAKASGGVPEIRIEWAVALARLRKYKEAQSALAGVSPPNDPDQRIQLHRLKGSVALGLGDSRTAASEMEKALTLKPADTALVLATAVAELQSKNAKRATSLAGAVYSRTGNPEVGFIVLQAELESHADFHPTLNSLRATPLPPSEQLAFRQRLAAVLISHKEIAEAITELQAAASLDPSRPDLQYNLALAQFQAGRLEDAAKSAEKCKDLGDDADLEGLIGDIQEALGNNLDAVKSYQAAIGLAPSEEKYRLSLAVELIRHSNLDAARVVLQQAQALQPNSWRIELALGMVEYLAGTDDDATRYLLHAFELAPQPENALQSLADVQMDRASAPDPAAITKLCEYSDHHPKDGRTQYYCGAVSFRRDYVTGDKSRADEILKRLHTSENLLPKDDASPHCQLGKAYRWLERWPEALTESRICARLDPDSADAHYRLAQIYQHLGQPVESQKERKLFEVASTKVADENARREATMKTFIYTMQNQAPDQK
jgi:Flp pilus assembly protein TadD